MLSLGFIIKTLGMIMKREYPSHPVVGVAGVIFQGPRVLLAKRSKDPGKGTWSLPGGGVELGETLEEALKREILEETALEIRIGGLVRVLDRIMRDEKGAVRFHYVLVDYWGWVRGGSPRAGSDASQIRFVDVTELDVLDIHKEVKDTIFQAIKKRNTGRGDRVEN